MTRRPAVGLLAAALLPTLGCATVFRGTKQQMQVTSEPRGAEVLDLPTGTRFTTPATVLLARDAYHTLHVSKEGYVPQQVPLRREVSVGYWVADGFTLFIGTAIDFGTGAIFHIKPRTVHVVLEPRPESPPEL